MRSRTVILASLAVMIAGALFVFKTARSSLPIPPATLQSVSPLPRPLDSGQGHPLSQKSTSQKADDHKLFSDPTFTVDIEALRSWADNDPFAAANYAEQLPNNPARAAALETVAIAWANRDLTAALKWGQEWPIEAEHHTILMAIGVEAARTDPFTALTLASELTPGLDRDELISRAAAEWAVTAPTAARDWALQITDQNLRTKTVCAIAIAWADSDPNSAATLAVEQLPPGRLEEDAIVAIVQRWAQQSPEQAAAWVNNFQEGDLKTSARVALNHDQTQTADQ